MHSVYRCIHCERDVAMTVHKPMRPKRPCNHAGCLTLTNDRFCPTHTKEYNRSYNRFRGTTAERGYGSRWQKARKPFLRDNPTCVECRKKGKLTEANTVDHIIPHKGNQDLFWDRDNWQAMCTRCHNVKTATEDGGFGNKIK